MYSVLTFEISGTGHAANPRPRKKGPSDRQADMVGTMMCSSLMLEREERQKPLLTIKTGDSAKL